MLLPHNAPYSEAGELGFNIFLCPHLNFIGNEKKGRQKGKKREKKEDYIFFVKLNSQEGPYAIGKSAMHVPLAGVYIYNSFHQAAFHVPIK